MGYFFPEVFLLWAGAINKNIGFFPTGAFIPNAFLLGSGEYSIGQSEAHVYVFTAYF